jgi:glycogen debranching enzyme
MDIEDEAVRLLRANRRSGYSQRHGLAFAYTCPSPREYPYQWFWDSCFHAVVLARLEPAWAIRELRSLVSVQRSDGFLPHVVFWQTGPVTQYWKYLQADNPFWPRMTGYIQPPVLAYAALTVFQATQDGEFAREMLTTVRKYHQWLRAERDPDADGLISIVSPFESGLDWSPQFDSMFGDGRPGLVSLALTPRVLDLRHWLARHDDARMLATFDVEEVLTNSMWYEAQTSLATLADSLGEGEIAQDEARHAACTQRAILEKSWDPEAGAFFSLAGKQERRLRVLTAASLAPFILDELAPEQQRALHAHIDAPERFGTPNPLPSVAVSEPTFESKPRYLLWRGPTWLNLNWLVQRGLTKHGEHEAAARLARKTAALVERSSFRECYEPFAGSGLGARDFGWSTLVVDMLRRVAA